MIRRALLIAAAAVALSAAGALAFTPAFARAGRSWGRGILRTAFGITLVPRSVAGTHATNSALLPQDDRVQGTFCPIRPPVDESTALIPESSSAQISADPGASATIEASTPAAEDSLLAPTQAICRASPAAPRMQSGDRR